MIAAEYPGRPTPPWQGDGANPPSAASPPPAETKARTVFGLAGELKNLVREDRVHRSDQSRRLKRAKKSP
jgi:hypothetical protein